MSGNRRNSARAKSRRGAPKRRGRRRRPRNAPRSFWGESIEIEPASTIIEPSEEPATVVRSLGPPPLAGRETIAEHYFEAVYEKAVGLAGALAAAAQMLPPPEEPDEAADGQVDDDGHHAA